MIRVMTMRCVHCDFPVANAFVSQCPRCEKPPFSDTRHCASAANDGKTTCPKCNHIQPSGAKACNRCGLKFQYAARFKAQSNSDELPDNAVGTTLKEHWDRIEGNLEAKDMHYKFIDLCAASGHVKYAGQCYRRLLEMQREDKEIELLKAYQERVIAKATLHLTVAKMETSRPRGNRQLLLLIMGGLMILGFAFLYYQWSKTSAALQNAF